jgi:hypothetical protein
MYVHSLWSEADAPLGTLAAAASDVLGVSATVSERSAELPVYIRSGEVNFPDVRWKQDPFAEQPPSELLSVRLYRTAFAAGIASVNPNLNFWLRERLGEYLRSPLRLPQYLLPRGRLPGWDLARGGPPGWQLSALHLQHTEAHTDVVVQGDVDSPGVLLREAGRLDDYGLAGLSLTDARGRMMTLYDEGQIWLQQVDPDEVPDLIILILPLFGRG